MSGRHLLDSNTNWEVHQAVMSRFVANAQDPSLNIKIDILSKLVKARVALSTHELSKIVNLEPEVVSAVERKLNRTDTVDKADKALSYDIVLAFNIGNRTKIVSPPFEEHGNWKDLLKEQLAAKEPYYFRDISEMSDREYNFQLSNYLRQLSGHDFATKYQLLTQRHMYEIEIERIKQQCEQAGLSCKLIRGCGIGGKTKKKKKRYNDENVQISNSEQSKIDNGYNQMIYLLIGITEDSLKNWGLRRNVELNIIPEHAVLQGRKMEFKLATATKLTSNIVENDNNNNNNNGNNNMMPTINENNDYLKVNSRRNSDDIDNDNDDDDMPNFDNNIENNNNEQDWNEKLKRKQLDISLWKSMHVHYTKKANPDIYRKYPRIAGKSRPLSIFDEKTRIRLIYEAMTLSMNEGGAELDIESWIYNDDHPLSTVFGMPNLYQLDFFKNLWVSSYRPPDLIWAPLEEIKDYFGESIGFYFSFLVFYIRRLFIPSTIGLVFFIYQCVLKSIDFPGIMLLSLLMIIWCVMFIDFWKRREAKLRLKWGISAQFAKNYVNRPQFQGTSYVRDEITGEWRQAYNKYKRHCIQFLTTLCVIGYLCCSLACVFFAIYVRDDHLLDSFDATPSSRRSSSSSSSSSTSDDSDDSETISTQAKVIVGVINGITIFLFDQVFVKLSKFLNDLENHRTEFSYHNSLIMKTFLFKFVNAFASLFYLAFYRPDLFPNIYSGYDNESDKNGAILEDVRLQLLILFLIQILLQNFFELLIPSCKKRYRQSKTRVDIIKNQQQSKNKKIDAIITGLSLPEQEILKENYDSTLDDMSEMVVQFGFINLFVVCFPLTPLLALVNNVIEMKVDGHKLVYDTKRPIPVASHGLGVWIKCLDAISIMSVFTNVALLSFRTNAVERICYDWLNISRTGHNKTDLKYSFFIVACCILIIIFLIEKQIIANIPRWVEKAMLRQTLIDNVLAKGSLENRNQHQRGLTMNILALPDMNDLRKDNSQLKLNDILSVKENKYRLDLDLSSSAKEYQFINTWNEEFHARQNVKTPLKEDDYDESRDVSSEYQKRKKAKKRSSFGLGTGPPVKPFSIQNV